MNRSPVRRGSGLFALALGAWGVGAVTPIVNTVVGAGPQRGQLVLNIHKVTPEAGFQLIILCFGQFSRRVRHSFIPSQRSRRSVFQRRDTLDKLVIGNPALENSRNLLRAKRSPKNLAAQQTMPDPTTLRPYYWPH